MNSSKMIQKSTWDEIISRTKPVPRLSAAISPPDEYLYLLRSRLSYHINYSSRASGPDLSKERAVYFNNQIDDSWCHNNAVKLLTLRQHSLIGGLLNAVGDIPHSKGYNVSIAAWYADAGSSKYKNFSFYSISSPTSSSCALSAINTRARRGRRSGDGRNYKMNGHDYLMAFVVPLKPTVYDIVRSGKIVGENSIRSLSSIKLAFSLPGMAVRSAIKRNYYGRTPFATLVYTSKG